jgi:hypothetical protein
LLGRHFIPLLDLATRDSFTYLAMKPALWMMSVRPLTKGASHAPGLKIPRDTHPAKRRVVFY